MNGKERKIRWQEVLLPAMVALLIFLALSNASQADRIKELNRHIGDLNAELSDIRLSVSSIYDNVDERLKQQASLLTGVSHSLGAPDTAKHTVDVEIKVVPKTVTDSMKLSVKIGDTVTALRRSGTEFTASVPVEMFLGYEEYPMLYIESDGVTQTEALEKIRLPYLYTRYLPTLHADIGSYADYTKGTLAINSHLTVSVKPTEYSGEIAFTKYELVTEINGEETEREDITAKIENGEYDGQFTKTVKAVSGDRVVIYVEGTDSLGYIHKVPAFTWQRSESGAVAEAVYVGERIYDADGTLLSEPY